MGKFIKYAFTAMFFYFASAAGAGAEEWSGNLNLQFGPKTFSDNWKPVENQPAFGINVDFGQKSWPLHVVAGYSGSSTTRNTILCDPSYCYDLELNGSTSEISVGAQKNWEIGNTHPYFAFGLSSITAKGKTYYVSDEDSSTGFFFEGGIFWRLGSAFNLGFNIRTLTGTSVTILNTTSDVDYTQLAALIGWGW